MLILHKQSWAILLEGEKPKAKEKDTRSSMAEYGFHLRRRGSIRFKFVKGEKLSVLSR